MRFVKVFLLVLATLVWPRTYAHAAAPGCLRGPALLLCDNGQGQHYSIASSGADTVTRALANGRERTWAQTASRYGQLTIFSGVASDGEVWLGRIQKLGWTTLSHFSSSHSGSQTVRCNRLTGCSQVQASTFLGLFEYNMQTLHKALAQ